MLVPSKYQGLIEGFKSFSFEIADKKKELCDPGSGEMMMASIQDTGKLPLISLVPWCNENCVVLVEKKHDVTKETQKVVHLTSVKDKSEIRQSENLETSQNQNGHEVFGNPLECPFDVTEDDIRNSSLYHALEANEEFGLNNQILLHPLSTKHSRCLMSAIYGADNDNKMNLPIWLVCDAKDNDKTSMIGFIKTDDTNHRAFIKSYGPLKEKELPSFSEIKTDQSVAEVYASYSVSYFVESSDADCNNTAFQDQINASSSEKSYIKLDCHWSDCSHIFQLPPHDATTTLCAKVILGNKHSPCFNLYTDLKAIENFVNGLESGEITWIKTDDNQITAMQKVKEFIEIQRDRSALKQAKEKQSIVSFDDCFKMRVVGKRDNHDATDNLYQVLTLCDSYENLVSCLKYFFDAVLIGDMYPFIFPKNKTKIASFLLESTRGQSQPPSLDDLNPLKLFIEIGIEKLKRDFLHFFITSELTTLEHVNNLLPDENSSYKDQVSQLRKLLHIVELIASCKLSLNLPKQYLFSICQKALVFYKDLQNIDPPKQFEMFLPMSLVKDLYSRMELETWRLTLNSSEDSYNTTIIGNFSTSNIYPHVSELRTLDESQTNLTAIENGDAEMQYYCSILTSITDKRF